MDLTTLPQDIEKELLAARHAELEGKHGRARVCARRAAGLAVRSYFKKIHHPESDASLYQLLELFVQIPGIPIDSKRLAQNLTTRVSPDFSLPSGIDLVDISRSFCEKVILLK